MSFAAYFRYYRLARAGLAALCLFAATAVMSWARRDGPPIRESVTGTITEVIASGLATDQTRLVRVRLPDGRQGRVLVPVYAASAGGRVPLLLEGSDGGGAYVAFDEARWLDTEVR